jgi:hypothetical protein
MKWMKQILALCVLTVPAAAFAAGSASGTVTVEITATYGDVVLVKTSGAKSSNPCGTGLGGWYFLLPKTSAFYDDLFTLLVQAHTAGASVTVTGTGTCSINSDIETIAAVNW